VKGERGQTSVSDHHQFRVGVGVGVGVGG
jgi:hypothetical protein